MNQADSRFLNAEASILGSLSEAQKAAMMGLAVNRSARRGEVLLTFDEPGATMILIHSGVCKVCLYTASGKEIILDYLGPGQVVGEISLFDEQPRTASVIVVEKCEITEFQRRDVIKLVQADSDMALRIIKVLCSRIRRTNQLLESDRSYAMGPKLARGLMRLIEDHGAGSSANAHVRFSISQGDLGNFVSLSRENVNRQLSEWQENGIIELRGGRIHVLARDALQEIADFSAT